MMGCHWYVLACGGVLASCMIMSLMARDILSPAHAEMHGRFLAATFLSQVLNGLILAEFIAARMARHTHGGK